MRDFLQLKAWLHGDWSDGQLTKFTSELAMTPSIFITSPYTEFQAELDQIQKHKWLVSEKEGKDVGFDRALTEWVSAHRQEWRLERIKNAPKT
jgi:hypothetical protein